ncbi:MAG: hypothetical protein K6V73_09085 [Firmicutes bacterium]|nr:hypothetical protein [Bacillota bacterium]
MRLAGTRVLSILIPLALLGSAGVAMAASGSTPPSNPVSVSASQGTDVGAQAAQQGADVQQQGGGADTEVGAVTSEGDGAAGVADSGPNVQQGAQDQSGGPDVPGTTTSEADG